MERTTSAMFLRSPTRVQIEDSDEAMFSLDGPHLSLMGSKLTTLPSFLAKKHKGRPILEFVTSLDASVNNLESVEPIAEFTKLTKFSADHNKLEATSFDGLPVMPTVDTLWLNNNNIVDVGYLVSHLAKIFPNLGYLSLLNNPGCPNPFNEENKEKYQKHRYFIISRFPKLHTLDATPVSPAEREYVQLYKPTDFKPIIPGGVGVLSPFNKDTIGFQVVKQGELTVMDEVDEYCTWNPSYVKTGEGKLIIFKDSKHLRPEGIIPLQGYEVSIVEDEELLKRLAPQLELLKLTHKTKKTYFLACQDKPAMQEWLPILVDQCQDKTNQDWDAIERQSTQMKLLQEDLKKRSSQVRLKRALDQSYSIDAKEIKLIKVLGHGGFGTVYHATVRNKSVAAKVFHNQTLTAEAIDDFCTEVEILAKIHHPQIITFIGACLEPLMIVTELMVGGDLEKLLLDSSTPLSFLTRLRLAKDAALGMAWLHGSNPMILHRDVKTANFLVDENLRVVVADFGLSESLRQGASTWDDAGYKGTIYFTSPEVLKNAVFNEKADVYSFGIVLWQILTREKVYPEFKDVKTGDLDKEIFDKVVFNHFRPAIPDDCPETYRKLMTDCWDADPEKRPSFDEAVQRIIDEIYFEAIPDEHARNLWREWFPGREKVRFKNFWETFVWMVNSSFSATAPPSVPASPRGLVSSNDPVLEKTLLRELLSPIEDVVHNPVNTGFVTIEAFGDFVQSFGPLHKNHNIIKHATRIVKQKWFFGGMSINQAFNFLNDQPAGTFLIRYSKSRKGDFSASYVAKDKKITHQHIDRIVEMTDEGPKITFRLASSNLIFRDLVDLVDSLPHLRNPCPGHPYASVFARRFNRDSVHDEFIDTVAGSPTRAILKIDDDYALAHKN